MYITINDSLYGGVKKNKYEWLVNVIIVFVAVVLLFEIVFGMGYSGVYVEGPSMSPTLTGADLETDEGGDYVYVSKYAVPDYFDIVVIERENEPSIIKRVIAKGGDRVRISGNVVSVRRKGEESFQALTESYVVNKMPDSYSFHNDEDGYLVPEGYLFVLGDNRPQSADSRLNGGTPYPENSVYGVVTDWSLKYKKTITSLYKFFHFSANGCGSDKNASIGVI